METHVRTLGILFIIFGVMGIIAGLSVLAVFGLGGALIPECNISFLSVGVGLAMAFIVAVSSLPGILAGWGLLSHRKWARIVGLVVGVINLPGFPLGTALGVYALWVLLNKETVRMFEQADAPTPAA